MATPVKLKLLPRSTIKAKSLTRFPANVVGTNGVSVTQSGADYQIGLANGVAIPGTGTTNALAVYNAASTIAASTTLSTATTAALQIEPAPSTLTRGIDIVQTGPTSGTSAGPTSLNLITASYSSTTTPLGFAGGDNADFGNWEQAVNAFRVNFTIGGSNLGGESIAAGTFHTRHTSDSSAGDKVGLIALTYSNAVDKTGGGGLFGAAFGAIADTGAQGNQLVGVEVDIGVRGTGQVDSRFAFYANNVGTGQSLGNDAAFAVGGGTVGGEFKQLMFMNGGLSATADLFVANTNVPQVANVFNLPDLIVSSNILNFPNARMSGAGVLKMGSASAGQFSSSAGYLVQASVASGGTASLASRANSTTGYNGLDTFTSDFGNEIAVLANEASRTATMFGITLGSYAQIVALGASNSGLLIGTTVNKPVVLGMNDTEMLRLTANTFTLTTGATNVTKIARISDATTFNVVALNGTITAAGYIGAAGGGDNVLYLQGGSSGIKFKSAGTDLAAFSASGGLSVGDATSIASGVISAVTGFRVNNASATSGNVLRGNGTNFVSAQLAAADLSNGTTGSGSVVLATAPTVATSITCPLHYGGTASSSTLTLASTSGSGTTDAIAFQTGSQVHRGGINTSGQWWHGPNVTPNTGVKLTVNSNTVAPAAITNTGGVVAQFAGADSTQAGMLLDSFGASATSEGFFTIRTARGTQTSPTASLSGDFLGFFGMIGATGAGTFGSNTGGAGGVFFGAKATENWDATHQGAKIEFYATPTGSASLTNVAIMQSGLQIGAPTGGDKGAGTINVATNIYLNNTAYTNPDYALEHYFTGKVERFADNLGAENYGGLMPLADLGGYLRENLRLPGINDEPCGIFTRTDIALEKIEEAMIYILQLNERLDRIEGEKQ